MLGGLSAVLWTDAMQFVILVGGAIWVGVSLLLNVPEGWSGIIEVARDSGKLDIFSLKMNLFELSALAMAINAFIAAMQDYGTDQITCAKFF